MLLADLYELSIKGGFTTVGSKQKGLVRKVLGLWNMF